MKVKAQYTFHYRSKRLEKGNVYEIDEEAAGRLIKAKMVKQLFPTKKRKRKTKEEKFDDKSTK